MTDELENRIRLSRLVGVLNVDVVLYEARAVLDGKRIQVTGVNILSLALEFAAEIDRQGIELRSDVMSEAPLDHSPKIDRFMEKLRAEIKRRKDLAGYRSVKTVSSLTSITKQKPKRALLSL
jgi:hypothetical protein